MRIIYLGYFIEPALFEKMCIGNSEISIASHRYENSLLKYILVEKRSGSKIDVDIFSSVFVHGNATTLPEEADFCGATIRYFWCRRGKIPSFVRALLRAGNELRKLLKEAGDDTVILSYSLNPVLIWPILFPTKVSHKVVTICSEIPRYRIIDGNRIIGKIKYSIQNAINKKLDGYILLSKYMNEHCNPQKKPWIVVEGLPDVEESAIQHVSEAHENYIMYAGGLEPEYGINNLVDAFMTISGDYRLVICGKGSSEAYVVGKALMDKRIEYRGMIENKIVQELERKALLLINPRIPEEKLTRYSFPSKTIEYMLSGTPMMTARLEGIPDEYFDYCYLCNPGNAISLAHDIETVLRIPEEERLSLARKAKEFVLTQKEARTQVQKILRFLENELYVEME